MNHRDSFGGSNRESTYVCDSLVSEALFQECEVVGRERRHAFGPRLVGSESVSALSDRSRESW